MSDWLPIETAPRNGSMVLVARKRSRWEGYLAPGSRRGCLVETAYYSPRIGCWRVGRSTTHESELSHWMPLPTPPQNAS